MAVGDAVQPRQHQLRPIAALAAQVAHLLELEVCRQQVEAWKALHPAAESERGGWQRGQGASSDLEAFRASSVGRVSLASNPLF